MLQQEQGGGIANLLHIAGVVHLVPKSTKYNAKQNILHILQKTVLDFNP